MHWAHGLTGVGAARDGVTRKRAEAELRDRLVKVDRKGRRKPALLTFATFTETWFEGSESRRWHHRTRLFKPFPYARYRVFFNFILARSTAARSARRLGIEPR